MSRTPWVEIEPPEEATGDLKRAYEKILATRGRVPDIRSVMAGEPLVVEGFAYFYPENNYACHSIDRRLAEMIATVASVANGSKFGGPAHARQLAQVVREADTLHRPVTASVADWSGWSEFLRSDAVDYINFHPYPPDGTLDRRILEQVPLLLNTYHKPVLIGEVEVQLSLDKLT